jgi:hypothetical protein
MKDYAGAAYQAPYRNGLITYEPDGSTYTDGRNLFDSVSFCLDCHDPQTGNPPTGTTRIDWDFDQHGKSDNEGKCDWGNVKEPYSKGGVNEDFNYVLSCLDCHEPHGSPNEYLLRQEVNGVQIPNIISSTHRYYYFCLACHTVKTGMGGHMPNPSDTLDCWGCHRHGQVQSSGMCSNAKTF